MTTPAAQAPDDSPTNAQVRREAQIEREQAWVAILLAWIGGAVDAIGYVALFHLFTAHMSGNSVAMGAHLGREEWPEAFRRMFPIPVFVLGCALGGIVTELAGRRGARSVFAPALVLEASLLVAFMICGSTDFSDGAVRANPAWKFYLLAALPAAAMGIQSATLRRVGSQTVRTNYVTGLLSNLTEEGVAFLFWFRNRARHANVRTGNLRVLPEPSAPRAMLLGGIYAAYVFGAVLGGYTELHWSLFSLFIPLCGLAFVIGCDIVRPIYKAEA